MEWNNGNWTPMINALRKGRGVVPVIGPALQLVPDENGCPVPFTQRLANHVAAGLPAGERGMLPTSPTLHELALAPSFRGRPARFAENLREAQDELLPQALAALFPERETTPAERHPLRLLAEIGGLPLFVSTTPDSLLREVLVRVRGLDPLDHVRGFQLVRERPAKAISSDQRAGFSWDLPPGWDPASATRPFLFHLFGRLEDPDGQERFDITEEDHLEMLCRLQSESYQPEQLIRELRPAHILLLGQPLAPWHARFLLRLLRGQRLSAREDATAEAVVEMGFAPGPEPGHYQELAAFLDNFSETTRIYRQGSPEHFVRELHRRWSELKPAAPPSPPTAAAQGADLARDGVFISYCSKDDAAARALAEGLRASGIKAYLDKSRAKDPSQPGLEHGSDFESKLRQNIDQAVFFIPLLSANTQRGGYFRKEWEWAVEHNRQWFGFNDRGYLRAIVVDESPVESLRGVPPEFQSKHILRIPGGKCPESFVTELKAGLEKWRGQTPAS